MPFLIWPALAGIGGLFVGSTMGGVFKSLVRLAVIGALAYGGYLMWGKS